MEFIIIIYVCIFGACLTYVCSVHDTIWQLNELHPNEFFWIWIVESYFIVWTASKRIVNLFGSTTIQKRKQCMLHAHRLYIVPCPRENISSTALSRKPGPWNHFFFLHMYETTYETERIQWLWVLSSEVKLCYENMHVTLPSMQCKYCSIYEEEIRMRCWIVDAEKNFFVE